MNISNTRVLIWISELVFFVFSYILLHESGPKPIGLYVAIGIYLGLMSYAIAVLREDGFKAYIWFGLVAIAYAVITYVQSLPEPLKEGIILKYSFSVIPLVVSLALWYFTKKHFENEVRDEDFRDWN